MAKIGGGEGEGVEGVASLDRSNKGRSREVATAAVPR